MVSTSYPNLLELASGEPSSLGRLLVTVPGIIPDVKSSHESDPEFSSPSSSSFRDRTIIVSNHLPIRAHRSLESSSVGWSFSWDDDALLLQLKDSVSSSHCNNMDFIFIGCLRDEIPVSDQELVSQTLLESFKCVPVFLPPDLLSRFYHGFCKTHLWPLFHSLLPLSSTRYDRTLFQSYVSANKHFADKILEVINPDRDFVWVHDYHLMVLPTFLRKRFNWVKLGFFLHSPFPSSEIYKTLPVREQILRSMLNSDLIGFHTFDYARHFLSCCSRMLGLTYESKRGYIGLEYYGRTVSIKILPVGIHLSQLKSVLSQPATELKVAKLVEQFLCRGQILLLGVDDMDIFKGISLKLLAFEQLLIQHPEWVGRVVLVQIANPARGKGKDVKQVQAESYAMVKRINDKFGQPGYDPVIMIDKPLKFYERMA